MLSPHYVVIISCYHTFNYASGWSGIVVMIRQMGVVIISGTTVTLGDGV